MESDYGCSFISADSIIEEEEYPPSQIYETDIVEEDEEEKEEMYIPLEKPRVSKNKQTPKVGKVKQINKKRKFQKKLTGTDQFYQLILSWDIDKLLLDNRKGLGLALLSEMPSYFPNKLEYFETMRQVAVEEARASIYQGLKVPNGSMELKINKLHSFEDTSFLLIEFMIIKGDIDMTRPGWVFKLYSRESNHSKNSSKSKNDMSSGNNSSSNGSNKTNYSHSKNSKSQLQNGKSNLSLHSNQEDTDNATIAVVAQGKSAMSLSIGVIIDVLYPLINLTVL